MCELHRFQHLYSSFMIMMIIVFTVIMIKIKKDENGTTCRTSEGHNVMHCMATLLLLLQRMSDY